MTLHHSRRLEAIRDISAMAQQMLRFSSEGGDLEHAFNLHFDGDQVERIEREMCAMVDAMRSEVENPPSDEDPEPVSDAETYTIDDFRAFADRNDDRYNELWYGENSKGEPSPEDEKAAGIVSVVADDVFIVTPFFSSCGRESVDPVECYGLEKFAEWKTLARAAMDRGL